MNVFNHSILNKLCFGLIVAASAISITHAVPPASIIIFSANSIASTSNNQGSMLNGDAQINIGSNIKISADKVLVKYVSGNQHEVSEVIIYGNGNLKVGKNNTQFTNGVFNPITTQLIAENIKRITRF
jgi:hypothetical protein